MVPARPSVLHSMQLRMAMGYGLVIAVLLVLLNTYPLLMTQNLMFRSQQTALENQAALVVNSLTTADELTAETLEQAIAPLDELDADRILVTDEAGLVLYDTGEAPAVGKYILTGDVVSALRGNDAFSSRFIGGAFQSRASAPVMTRGTVVGAVCLWQRDEGQGLLLGEIQRNLRLVSLVVGLVVLTIFAIFSTRLTSRVSTLLGGIRTVRAGEYTHRVSVTGHDELAQLADEFNQLTGRLQATEEERRRFVSDASHELKTPLASIRLMTDTILQDEAIDRETTREFGGPAHPHQPGAPGPQPPGRGPNLPPGAGGRQCPGGADLPDAGPPGPGGRGHGGDRSGRGLRGLLRPRGREPDLPEPHGERHQIQCPRRDGHRVYPPGGGPCPAGGGRHRHGHPRGGPGADLSAVLPGGQGPVPGRRRHRPGAVHRPGHRPPPRRDHRRPAERGGRHGLFRVPARLARGGDAMKRIILSLLLFAVLFPAAGCVRAAVEGPVYQVYFLSEEVERDLALVPEGRSLPEGEDPIEALLAILLEGPESEELTSPFPAGVTLRGWELKDGVVTVDFSARYAALSGVALTLADYSVVDTLCQLETVDAVEITADGDRLTYRDHQRMTASDAWTLEEIEAEEP